MKKKKLKAIPRFRNEDEERDFWAKVDSSEYFDFSKFRRAKFSNLKISTERISLRLTKGMLEDIKVAANKRDVPYQSFIKMVLAKEMERENASSVEQS